MGEFEFHSPEIGLEICLRAFLKEPKFYELPLVICSYMDRIARDYTPLSQIDGIKNKLKYAIGRYTPYFEIKQR